MTQIVREILSASPECGEGEKCWFNPETGYMEHCRKHEGMLLNAMSGHVEGDKVIWDGWSYPFLSEETAAVFLRQLEAGVWTKDQLESFTRKQKETK